MRIWEFEDQKAMATDLVREQDFILRVRRIQRQATPCFVVNFILTALEALAANVGPREMIQEKIKAHARATKGEYYEMSNGDVFIVWDQVGKEPVEASKAIEALLASMGGEQTKFVQSFQMPQNYVALRKRTNDYVDLAREMVVDEEKFTKGQVSEAEGHLTAKTLDRIEKLVNDIDLRHYARTQTMYRSGKDGWQPVGEEYFISLNDLKRERFPKLEVISGEHFFQVLCGILDKRLLGMLTESYEILSGRRMNLNLSVLSIMGPVFAHFVRRIPRKDRGLMGFEIHRGDLFQDFSLTLSAFDILKREGFRVILDSVTPNMLPYLNLAPFPVDTIKINASKERAAELSEPGVYDALARLPADKLVFFRCDNEQALSIGRKLGVSVFQGWLINDLAGKKISG